MTNSNDSLARRDFLKTLGVAALPLLATACDPEPEPELELDSDPGPDPSESRFRGSSSLRTNSVEVGRALLEQLLIGDRQRCSLPGKLRGLADVGRQIRIDRPGYGAALYTVDELRRDDNPDYVRMSLSARLRIGTSEGFEGVIRNRLTASDLSDEAAEASSEFVERIVNRDSDSIVVVAPHGGGIELRTDQQAERLTAALADRGASSWICKGWNEGGGAFDRWHIRSTDIHPSSFPGLAAVTKRSFGYAVAFHGMDVGGVLIGGSGPADLKQELASAIRFAVGKTIEVGIADTSDIYDGDSPNNLVNWVTTDGLGGIQIEQSRMARLDHWEAIADAIASVFKRLL